MSNRKTLANAIRFLSMDAVQKANSGHPGMPMGMADIAEVLFNDFLQHNPKNPNWHNRDRFVLSNGHGSMLQYALLHLTGYDVSIDDLKNFRQLDSKTPGHPEFLDTPGVETTTGPLGQGLANAVGLAIAEKNLSATFNQEGFPIIDHFTYVFAGDGCLMEGISHEACSLAGTLGLGKLVMFYDDNGISIDGDVEGWFTDNTPERFHAYGWHVLANVDGHDTDEVREVITSARQILDKPSIICLKTKIGFGSPNLAGSEKTHGAPLGDEEIKATRKELNWQHGAFEIPDEIYKAWNAEKKGQKLQDDWQNRWDQYTINHPELAAELYRRLEGELPNQFKDVAKNLYQNSCQNPTKIATRKASLQCIEAFAKELPELLGGSADLTGSNLTKWSGAKPISKQDGKGDYLFYGVREFAMFAVMNGIALHGGFIPFGGTFLVFVDYGRNAVRLSAMMKQKVIFVLTHDSIGLGEDGPTHQPVEHAAMLRLTPGVQVWRPCDTAETAVAWETAIEHQGPSCLLLSRQNTEQQIHDDNHYALIQRGGYILKDCQGTPDAILIATGSEVEIAMAAADQLSQNGHRIRVVSMPSTTLFDQQDTAYKESVLPKEVSTRVAIEAAAADFWYKYVGLDGGIVGLNSFGKSAPGGQVYEALGITVANAVACAEKLLNKKSVSA